eukprot:3400028-Alexandrium_andersonii.AAC.1
MRARTRICTSPARGGCGPSIQTARCCGFVSAKVRDPHSAGPSAGGAERSAAPLAPGQGGGSSMRGCAMARADAHASAPAFVADLAAVAA